MVADFLHAVERRWCIQGSGVVEGDAGGWYPPNILEGDGIPQIIGCQGGCYSCNIPHIKLVATKFTSTRGWKRRRSNRGRRMV
jgi:hypothetical protein